MLRMTGMVKWIVLRRWGHVVSFRKKRVAAAIIVLQIGKAAGPTGVVSEMMKASGGFGTRWKTDLINNIVKEGCISDDWRKSILVPVYKEKGDPLVSGSYRQPSCPGEHYSIL